MAKEAVEKAIALNGDLAEGYSTLGLIHLWHDWDWKGSEQAFQRALVLNPRSAVAVRGAALLEKSIELSHRALELDPFTV